MSDLFFLVNILSFVVLVLTAAISFYRNADIFSPIKIYSIFSLFFYLDIYFGGYNSYVCAIYFCQNLALFLCAFYEPKLKKNDWDNVWFDGVNFKKVVVLVWLFSIVPVVNQLVLIQELGGFFGALGNIAGRVKYFQGKGYYLVLNSLFIVLNLMYFCVVIHKPRFKSLLLYSLHFGVLVAIGLLSGSRSFIVMTMLVMLVISNYLFRRVSVKLSVVCLFIMVVVVTVLGTLRNTISVGDKDVSFERFSITEKIELSHFKYGLIPLSIITESEVYDLQYGSTYFSLITNFVPRAIYPDKLDSGGIYFTRVYAGDAWGGDSNLATGAVTEGIINFGFFFGVIVGVLGILVFYIAGIRYYYLFLRERDSGRSFFMVIPYVYFILLAARYSYSEFSYVIFSYVLTVALPCFVFWFFYIIVIRVRRENYVSKIS